MRRSHGSMRRTSAAADEHGTLLQRHRLRSATAKAGPIPDGLRPSKLDVLQSLQSKRQDELVLHFSRGNLPLNPNLSAPISDIDLVNHINNSPVPRPCSSAFLSTRCSCFDGQRLPPRRQMELRAPVSARFRIGMIDRSHADSHPSCIASSNLDERQFQRSTRSKIALVSHTNNSPGSTEAGQATILYPEDSATFRRRQKTPQFLTTCPGCSERVGADLEGAGRQPSWGPAEPQFLAGPPHTQNRVAEAPQREETRVDRPRSSPRPPGAAQVQLFLPQVRDRQVTCSTSTTTEAASLID